VSKLTVNAASAPQVGDRQFTPTMRRRRLHEVRRVAALRQGAVEVRFGLLLHSGLQGFGEIGAWRDGSAQARQSRRICGRLAESWLSATKRVLKYQAACLMGKTYGAKGDAFSKQVELER
jgi:hypothetical protein